MNEIKLDEPKLKNKEKVIKKLKPFWKKYQKLESNLRGDMEKLEQKMTKDINLGINLEFFHVDGQCAGIGAFSMADRDKFPLIPGSELY